MRKIRFKTLYSQQAIRNVSGPGLSFYDRCWRGSQLLGLLVQAGQSREVTAMEAGEYGSARGLSGNSWRSSSSVGSQ
jgi:hypothetical protein